MLRTRCSQSHRRSEPVLAVIDARGLKRSVRLLLRGGDEKFCSRRDLAFVARHISYDHGVRRDEDLLLSVLVFQGQRLSIDTRHGLFDIGVGHRTLRVTANQLSLKGPLKCSAFHTRTLGPTLTDNGKYLWRLCQSPLHPRKRTRDRSRGISEKCQRTKSLAR